LRFVDLDFFFFFTSASFGFSVVGGASVFMTFGSFGASVVGAGVVSFVSFGGASFSITSSKYSSNN